MPAMYIQEALFNRIKEKIPAQYALVDYISELLGISPDSAYRRIRGEKILSLDEFYLLCKHFDICSDEVMNRKSDYISFRSIVLDEKTFRFEQYLEAVLNDFKQLADGDHPELMIILNELNLFQMLQEPAVAAFKFFFWSKSNLGFSDYRELKFTLDNDHSTIHEISRRILDIYIRVPTVELMATEAINSMLKQIRYYYETGVIQTVEMIQRLCDSLLRLIAHIRKQAELGFKFHTDQEPMGEVGNYQLYYNDMVLVDNTFLARNEKSRWTYLTNNAINLMITEQPDFFQQNYEWGRNLISKSILISGSAEKERIKFFRHLEDQVGILRTELSPH